MTFPEGSSSGSEHESLRLSEELYRATFEQTSAGIAHVGLDGRFLRVNDRLCEITGYPREELLKLTFQELTYPEDLEMDLANVRRLHRGEIERYRREKRYRHKLGHAIWASLTVSVMRDAQRRPLHCISVMEDITDRKAAEEKLAASEERFRKIFEHSLSGIAISDEKGRLVQCNPAYARIVGRTPEELRSIVFSDLVHPEDRAANTVQIHKLLAGEIPNFDIENRYVHADGRDVWVHTFVSLVRDEHGGPACLAAFATDVTERRRAETAAFESERQIADFANSIPTLAWIADAEGYIYWYNHRWYQYTGTTPDQMMGWGWQSVHDPEMLPAVMELWQSSIRSGKPCELVFPLRGADGVFRTFLTRVVPVHDAHGTIVRWLGTNTDIDELRRVREELAAERNRFRTLVEQASDAFFVHDFQGRFVDVNRQACESLGYSREELLAMSVTDVDHGFDLASAQEVWKNINDGEAHTLLSSHWRKNGAVFPVEARLSVCEIAGQRLFLGVVRDISERQRVEDTLRKNEKLALVGRLAATISHEINNPLEAVTNLLYLMETEEDLKVLRKYVHHAQQELTRVTHVATHTLRFNRQSNAATRERLSDLLGSSLAIYEGRLKHSGLKIVTDYDDADRVLCFSSELRQVFANLIGNAFDATRAGGTLRLRTRAQADWTTREPGVRVTVADTGHGMDRHTLQHLCEAFFTTKGTNGTGLGLWVSREILDKHQAKLKVKSRPSTPSGTVFTIWFPVSAPLAISSQPKHFSAVPSH
jgi:PAS domain S-box-containing protein